jgi:hypothetical protein
VLKEEMAGKRLEHTYVMKIPRRHREQEAKKKKKKKQKKK